MKLWVHLRVEFVWWLGDKLIRKWEDHQNKALTRPYAESMDYLTYGVPTEKFHPFYNLYYFKKDPTPLDGINLYRRLWNESPYPFWKKVWRFIISW